MSKVLIIHNEYWSGSGMIEVVLKEYNIPFITAHLHKGEEFPDPKDYAAVIVLGGPESANDKSQTMSQKIKQVKYILNNNIPFLGICLGLQILVKAAGGTVVPSPIHERGWRDPQGKYFEITLTKDGRNDPLLKGIPENFKVFQSHKETIEPTHKMSILATGKWCTNQAVRVGTNAYGIQAHIDLTEEMYQDWTNSPDLIKNKKLLLENYTQVKKEYQKTQKSLIANFLRIAKLVK